MISPTLWLSGYVTSVYLSRFKFVLYTMSRLINNKRITIKAKVVQSKFHESDNLYYK